MHRPSANGGVRAALALLAAVALSPGASLARSDSKDPDDLLDAKTYPGIRSILELNGEHVHSVGCVQLLVTNWGLIGSHPGGTASYAGAPSAQWPSGSTTDYLWGAGLWVGARKDGVPHVTTGQYDVEFRPGRTELDHIYVSRDGAPGGARKPSPNADDDRDGKTDEDWLDGRDNDGDGKIDEDFAAISNQFFFCEMNDTDSNIKLRLPEHVPLEILVQQSSMEWEDPLVCNFVAFDFKIINKGFNPLEEVYVGFFADCDIGPRGEKDISNDDLAGFWEGVIDGVPVGEGFKSVKVSAGYMWDEDGDEGRSEGYIGLMFLGAQDPGSKGIPKPIGLHNFRFFSGKAPFEQGGDPNNDAERYAVLDGSAPRSLGLPNALGIRPPQMAKKKDDYRMTVSAGPFAIVEPGDTLGFQSALVIGKGFDGMIENAVQAQLTYDGIYLDCDGDITTGQDGRETPVCGPDFAGQMVRFDPCDTTCALEPTSPRCSAQVPQDGCVWTNADCEIEKLTGVRTGIDGKECLIHWLIGMAPPPPNMRVVAKENEVDVLWDNLSETTPDMRLNVIDFESYRIWRADNWQRPFGSDVGTGPGADLWMLMGEYDLPRNGIGSDTGLDPIRYAPPSIPDAAVEFYREWFRVHPLQKAPALPGLTSAQVDTAQALARGVRYYRWVDPPYLTGGLQAAVQDDGRCPTVLERTVNGKKTAKEVFMRYDPSAKKCRETAPPPKPCMHYFYSVTATDHKLEFKNGRAVVAGPGLAGDPSSNFQYVFPCTNPLAEQHFEDAKDSIYVVPNPVTKESLKPARLQPNNSDPTGIKICFQHLPRTTGKVSIFTLSGDLVKELSFDARESSGSLTWDLVSRNHQDVTSGVYLYSVVADDKKFKRYVSKFVVIR